MSCEELMTNFIVNNIKLQRDDEVVATHPDGREKFIKAVMVMVTQNGKLAFRDMASQIDNFEQSSKFFNNDDDDDE